MLAVAGVIDPCGALLTEIMAVLEAGALQLPLLITTLYVPACVAG
jgi:hypothetical protein